MNVCSKVMSWQRILVKNATHPVSGMRRGCATSRYWTGSRSLEDAGGQRWPRWINRSADINWTLVLKGTRPDSPDNFSSSCSITERLSEKYCVTRLCRSAGQPGFGSEEDKTSVIVFFFWSTKHVICRINIDRQKPVTVIPLYNSRCHHTHLPLFFKFSWLFILFLALLRNNTLVLWKMTHAEHTIQAKCLYVC